MIEISYETIAFWFCTIFIASIGIQLFYYLFFYLRFTLFKDNTTDVKTKLPISIIVCAKNEEENLQKFLPIILKQKYSPFEVIVINDCSDDNSEIYLKNLCNEYPNLRISTIIKDEHFSHGKKLAITIGIKAAQYDHYVFIDADCVPETDLWLKSFQPQFNKADIILGYGGYCSKKGLLDKLIRYDTFSIAVNYMSFALAGIPYMGVGRNMAYTKNVYEQSSKFTKNYHILSGDDDLFVSEVGTRKNTRILLNPDSFTRSQQVSSFRNWKRQKCRHLTTSPHYKFYHKFLLGLEPLSRVLFYLLLVFYCIFRPQLFFWPIISLISLRMILFFTFSIVNSKKLHEKNLWPFALIFDIYLPIQIGLLHLKNKIHPNKTRW